MHIISGDLWAGAESQLFTLTSSLKKHLHITVSVVLFNHGKLEEMLKNEGIQVIVLDENNLNGFQILQNLTSIVRKIKPNVIHTHRSKENILGSIAARINGNIPSIRTQHGSPEHQPKWHQLTKKIIWFLDWSSGIFLQKKIIAVSELLAQQLREKFHEKSVYTIENGIDIDSLLQFDFIQEKYRSIPRKAYRIGIAGRLVPVKRIDIFIRCAKILKEKHQKLKIHFHIFGDGPLRQDLERLIRKLKTEKYISIEGYCDNLAQELYKLDALIMTSDHEGLPMTLLEAMVLRVPIIAHSVGGIPKLLNDGRCGILVENHTPSGYAHAIDRLIMDSDKRVQLTKNAFCFVKKYYSALDNAKKYYSHYLELADT